MPDLSRSEYHRRLAAGTLPESDTVAPRDRLTHRRGPLLGVAFGVEAGPVPRETLRALAGTLLSAEDVAPPTLADGLARGLPAYAIP